MIPQLKQKINEVVESKRKHNCDVCGGTSRATPGNGQIIDGHVLCDYCHSDHMDEPFFWLDSD